MQYVTDMEHGLNVSLKSSKGGRSYIRLNTIREKMYFFSRRFNEIYGLDLRVLRMSKYIHTKEFQDERERIMQICKSILAIQIFKKFPKIKLNPNVKNIDDFKFEDITVEDYDPHSPIKAEVTVVGGF